MTNRKTFILDGKNFTSITSFHDEIQRILCPNFKSYGRSWNAFNDVLRGGFGQFQLHENIKLIIKNEKRIRKSLGENFPNKLRRLITQHDHIELVFE